MVVESIVHTQIDIGPVYETLGQAKIYKGAEVTNSCAIQEDVGIYFLMSAPQKYLNKGNEVKVGASVPLHAILGTEITQQAYRKR